jgi:hypothetical protein
MPTAWHLPDIMPRRRPDAAGNRPALDFQNLRRSTAIRLVDVAETFVAAVHRTR